MFVRSPFWSVNPLPDGASPPPSLCLRSATVPLISRATLFGNPDRALPKISPDGVWIAYLAPVAGVMNLWVAPADALSEARPLTHDRGRGIQSYHWALDNRSLVYVQDRDGDENFHLYRAGIPDGETADLTPLPRVRALIHAVSPRRPGEVLVGLNDRDPRLYDYYRLNLETGHRELMFENHGYASVTADHSLCVRLASRFGPDHTFHIERVRADGGVEPFLVVPPEDVLTTHVLGFDDTEEWVYLLDSRGRDRAVLKRMHLDTGAEEFLADDPRADLDQIMIHPTRHHIQAVSANYTRREWRALDPEVASGLAAVREAARGDFTIHARTLDDRTWIITDNQPDGPVAYLRHDRDTGATTPLFTSREALLHVPLAPMHPVVLGARDGLSLVSYLTLPPMHTEPGGDRPRQPVPLVLWVHGGPWSRDTWQYNPFHQWLANRGYAVLSVNYRGSTGFGKGFLNAANREWGAGMQDDLLDAVDWAVAAGVADPAKVAIAGGSYGGYAALTGLTRTPERFACGVSLVGPSNLLTLLRNAPPYWAAIMPLLRDRIGDADTEEGRAFLASRSPLTYVDRICRPLLIGQGANDPRVTRAESDQIVEAMRVRGIPVTYVVYPDEGHGFVRPPNRLSFNAVMEEFLARHLDGRSEPMGADREGSSMEIHEY